MEDRLTLAQAAVLLGVAPSTLRTQAHRGRLRAQLIGKTWVVTPAEIERYRRESVGQPGRPRNAPTRVDDHTAPIAFDYVPAHFRFRFGEDERVLPALAGELLGRWHARYAGDQMAGLDAMKEAGAQGDLVGVFQAAKLTQEAIMDAVMEYDAAGALGGREWLVDHLSWEQLYLILHRIQAAHA